LSKPKIPPHLVDLNICLTFARLKKIGKTQKAAKFQAMTLDSAKKQELFSKHGAKKLKTDTGSPESQIALFTFRINSLTEHLKSHKKDFSTQQGLLNLVGQRKKLLGYLQKTNIDRYRSILAELELRK
jgi:small subunit ribosomal protein S15